MTSGNRGERIVVDDPHADAPEFVRWEPVLDARVHPGHAALPPGPAFFDAVEPPRSLGMFNCRGDYVYPAGSVLGNEAPVVILSQSGGQVADVLRAHDYRVTTALRIDPALLADLPSDDRFRREMERRRALLSEAVNEAMLRPGFVFAEHAFGGPALDRFLRGFPGSPPCASFTLTNNLSGDRPPHPPEVASGRFDVSGEVTAYFQNDALLRAMRRGQRGLNRRALLAFRPYLSRRAYRRLRGRMKENRR